MAAPAAVVFTQEAVLRLIQGYLQSCGLIGSLRTLEVESGCMVPQPNDDVAFLRELILDGRWEDVEIVVAPLAGRTGFDAAGVLFAARRQRFLELFSGRLVGGSGGGSGEGGDGGGATVLSLVSALRAAEGVAPNKAAFNELTYTLTLPSVNDHPQFARWTVHSGRQAVFEVARDAFMRHYPEGLASGAGAGAGATTAAAAAAAAVPDAATLHTYLAQAAGAQAVSRVLADPRLAASLDRPLSFVPGTRNAVTLSVPAAPDPSHAQLPVTAIVDVSSAASLAAFASRWTAPAASVAPLPWPVPVVPARQGEEGSDATLRASHSHLSQSLGRMRKSMGLPPAGRRPVSPSTTADLVSLRASMAAGTLPLPPPTYDRRADHGRDRDRDRDPLEAKHDDIVLDDRMTRSVAVLESRLGRTSGGGGGAVPATPPKRSGGARPTTGTAPAAAAVGLTSPEQSVFSPGRGMDVTLGFRLDGRGRSGGAGGGGGHVSTSGGGGGGGGASLSEAEVVALRDLLRQSVSVPSPSRPTTAAAARPPTAASGAPITSHERVSAVGGRPSTASSAVPVQWDVPVHGAPSVPRGRAGAAPPDAFVPGGFMLSSSGAAGGGGDDALSTRRSTPSATPVRPTLPPSPHGAHSPLLQTSAPPSHDDLRLSSTTAAVGERTSLLLGSRAGFDVAALPLPLPSAAYTAPPLQPPPPPPSPPGAATTELLRASMASMAAPIPSPHGGGGSDADGSGLHLPLSAASSPRSQRVAVLLGVGPHDDEFIDDGDSRRTLLRASRVLASAPVSPPLPPPPPATVPHTPVAAHAATPRSTTTPRSVTVDKPPMVSPAPAPAPAPAPTPAPAPAPAPALARPPTASRPPTARPATAASVAAASGGVMNPSRMYVPPWLHHALAAGGAAPELVAEGYTSSEALPALRFAPVAILRDTQPVRTLVFDPSVPRAMTAVTAAPPSDALPPTCLAVGSNAKALRMVQVPPPARFNAPPAPTTPTDPDTELPLLREAHAWRGLHLGSVYCGAWASVAGAASLIATGSNDMTVKVVRWTPRSDAGWEDDGEGLGGPAAGAPLSLSPDVGTVRDVTWLGARSTMMAPPGALPAGNLQWTPAATYTQLYASTPLLVAVGGGDHAVRIFDVNATSAAASPLVRLSGHSGIIHAVRPWGGDGTQLVTASADGSMRLWDIRMARAAASFLLSSGATSVLPGGASLPMHTSFSGAAGVVELHALAVCEPPASYALPRQAVVGTGDGHIVVVDLLASRMLASSRVHTAEVRSVDAMGPLVASASFDGTVAVSALCAAGAGGTSGGAGGSRAHPSAASLVTLHSRSDHRDKALCARWHPYAGMLATSSADRSVLLWRLTPEA